jgi:gluconokinase
MYSVYLPLVEFISPPQEIRVTGGFTRSPFWVQLLTNIFNRKFSVTKQPEGSVLGAAAFAFNALGKLNSLDKLKEINQIKQITTPDPDLHEFYQKKYEKTIRIYHKLKSDF